MGTVFQEKLAAAHHAAGSAAAAYAKIQKQKKIAAEMKAQSAQYPQGRQQVINESEVKYPFLKNPQSFFSSQLNAAGTNSLNLVTVKGTNPNGTSFATLTTAAAYKEYTQAVSAESAALNQYNLNYSNTLKNEAIQFDALGGINISQKNSLQSDINTMKVASNNLAVDLSLYTTNLSNDINSLAQIAASQPYQYTIGVSGPKAPSNPFYKIGFDLTAHNYTFSVYGTNSDISQLNNFLTGTSMVKLENNLKMPGITANNLIIQKTFTESLLPSQVFGQSIEYNNQYSGNQLNNILLSIGNSEGDIIANPAKAARTSGIFSANFAQALGLSVGDVAAQVVAYTTGIGIAGSGLTGIGELAATVVASSASFAAAGASSAAVVGESQGLSESQIESNVITGAKIGAVSGAVMAGTGEVLAGAAKVIGKAGVGAISVTAGTTASSLAINHQLPSGAELLVSAGLGAGFGELLGRIMPETLTPADDLHVEQEGAINEVKIPFEDEEGNIVAIRSISGGTYELLNNAGDVVSSFRLGQISDIFPGEDEAIANTAIFKVNDNNEFDVIDKGTTYIRTAARDTGNIIDGMKQYTVTNTARFISLDTPIESFNDPDFDAFAAKISNSQVAESTSTALLDDNGAGYQIGRFSSTAQESQTFAIGNPDNDIGRVIDIQKVNGNIRLSDSNVGDTERILATSTTINDNTIPTRLEFAGTGKIGSTYTNSIEANDELSEFRTTIQRPIAAGDNFIRFAGAAANVHIGETGDEIAGILGGEKTPLLTEKIEGDVAGFLGEEKMPLLTTKSTGEDIDEEDRLGSEAGKSDEKTAEETGLKTLLSDETVGMSKVANDIADAMSSVETTSSATLLLPIITGILSESSMQQLNSKQKNISSIKPVDITSLKNSEIFKAATKGITKTATKTTTKTATKTATKTTTKTATKTSTIIIPPGKSPGRFFMPPSTKKAPLQPTTLFPLKPFLRRRMEGELAARFAPFPDLLDVNEVANTGQKPVALNPNNPKTMQIYRRYMRKTGGLRYPTANQIYKKKGKLKASRKKQWTIL